MIRVCVSLVICMCGAVLYIHICKCLYNSAYTLEKCSKESNMGVFFVFFLNGKAISICNKVIEYLCGSILLIKSIFAFDFTFHIFCFSISSFDSYPRSNEGCLSQMINSISGALKNSN
jgi:hypothetical protein